LKLIFSTRAWEEYLHWQQHDQEMLARLNELNTQCQRTPFQGIGRPEPLVGNLKGFWSRRLSHEHRLVYRVSGKDVDQSLEIAACRFHYGR